MGFFIRDKGRLIFLQQNQFFWSRQQVLRAPKFEGTHLQKKKVVHLHRSTKHPDWEREQHAEPFVLRRHPQCIVLGRPRWPCPLGIEILACFPSHSGAPPSRRFRSPPAKAASFLRTTAICRVLRYRGRLFLGGGVFSFS